MNYRTPFSAAIKRIVATMVVFAALCARTEAKDSECPPESTSQNSVINTMTRMLAALRADDLAGFRAITTTDFYAYDGGQRFDGTELVELIKKGHAAGKRWEWNVTDPEVHLSCDLAWISYINRGVVEDASGRTATSWLESAVLEFHGKWRIRFLHSTRASH